MHVVGLHTVPQLKRDAVTYCVGDLLWIVGAPCCRVPVVLRTLGILTYSKELEDKVRPLQCDFFIACI